MDRSLIFSTGLAMFCMFFGAGNIVFPLALGEFAKDQSSFAIAGLLITAIGVPFLGLIGMILYEGDYRKFFGRLGKAPGFAIVTLIVSLIGPIGALPRCVALSYGTFAQVFPGISIELFTAVSCFLIFFFTYRESKLLDLLGKYLTPFLLFSLVWLIISGLYNAPATISTDVTSSDMFYYGLQEGYQTMDLLGAFFFSSIVLSCLKNSGEKLSLERLMKISISASCLAAFLLGAIYVGFCTVAAAYSPQIAGMKHDEMFAKLALSILGPRTGLIAAITVALACLTTAIALAAVFAKFLQKEVSRGKIGYKTSLTLTLIVTYLIASSNFTTIAAFLHPILKMLYPALIALTVLNIAEKVWKFRAVKTPVAITLTASILGYL